MIKYKFDLNQKGRSYPHYWEQCVGSCHAATILREDVRNQIRKAHKECGFQYLRFHGLFNDDMSVVIKPMLFGEPEISFFNIDSIFDFLLETGMKPFVELGFMPEYFASGKETCFHYKGNITPPADYDKWADFIRLFGEHLILRYGKEEVNKWFFEVWNEPNLKFFFSGNQEDYFKLYKVTAEALKSVDSSLRVGGPATSENAWIPQFIEFCKKENAPLDFITTHHYPSDDPLSTFGTNNYSGKSQSPSLEEALQSHSPEELQKLINEYFNKRTDNPRDVLFQMAKKAKMEAGEYPLYYTEWNGAQEFDTSYQAAFVIQTIAANEGLVEGYSYWTVTDIFEEMGMKGTPFKNEFGIQTIHGIAKPVYRAFQTLHEAGSQRLEVEGSHRTVEVLALTDGKTATVMVYNHDIIRRKIVAEEIELTIKGDIKSIQKTVIDDEHCNPMKTWESMGKPKYPTKQELQIIEEASKLQYSNEVIDNSNLHIIKFVAEPESVTIFKICY